MASRPLTVATSAFSLTTDWQSIYTVPTADPGGNPVDRAGIDAVAFNNYTSSTRTFSVRIVQEGVATSLNELITDEDIRAMANNLAPAIIGQAVKAGGKVEAKASANLSISATMTVTLALS